MTEPDRFEVRRDGPLAVVTLSYTDKLNVLDGVQWDRLGARLEALSDDDSVRCVVLRGAGGRAFSAGSDIGSFPEQRDTPDQVRVYARAVSRALEGVGGCRHPTVAAIEGLCVGGGMIVAAACDLRVCGRSSRFGAPINRLGLTMAYEELRPLMAAVGPGPTLEILLTGDLLDAGWAAQVGLVQRVVDDAEVWEQARSLALQVSRGAPLVNQWHKKFVRRFSDPRPLTEAEREEAYEAFRTADYREGRSAFIEKREPRFSGE